MLVVACISSHGFGHGARVAAVLQALAASQPQCRFVLSTALPAAFLRRTFVGLNYEHRPCQWDVGVVQADALGSDPAATLQALERLEQQLPQQIETEARWLEHWRQPHEPCHGCGSRSCGSDRRGRHHLQFCCGCVRYLGAQVRR